MHKIQVEQFCVEIMQQVYSENGRYIYKGKINFQGREEIIALKKQGSIQDHEINVLRILKEKKFQHIIEIIAFEQNADSHTYTIMELGKQIDLNNISSKLEVCLQMAQGVQEFHTLEFIHRDLKPENFVIGLDEKIKLIDFGNARKNTESKNKTKDQGTLVYMAPEVNTSQDYDSSVDIWSLGMIFYRIFTNEQFYKDKESDYYFMRRLVEQTQLQIDNVIKSQKKLDNWQKDLLQKMIVYRLDKNLQINQQIKRINIQSVVDELKMQHKSLIQPQKLVFKWKGTTEDVQFYNQNFTDKFQIEYTKDYKIIYSYKGKILREDQILDITVKPVVLKNLEQIKYLQWIGNCDQNKKQVGRWKAKWKGENLDNVGGEYVESRKQGHWIDLYQNYQSKAEVLEIGKYENDIRKGVWDFVYKNNKIGGGEYNDVGNKQGKWIDLFENFFQFAQVTYNGEYNMNNMKIGRWDIMYCSSGQDGKYKQIGGESYDQEGNQKKIGKLEELVEGFCKDKQIGGGLYDQEGNQKKIGKWVELFEGFQYYAQLTYNGEYNMNNMKVGRWDIMFCKYNEKEYKQIGGGLYDDEGNQKKIGKWVELDEEFNDDKQVTHKGEYNFNNMKVGRWDIMNLRYTNYFCGCINFDENGKEIYRSTNKNIIFVGSFKNCMKIGRWDFMYCDKHGEGKYHYNGDRLYYTEGNSKTIGNQIGLNEKFKYDKLITQTGEYGINGLNEGIWYIKQDGEQEYKLIGGGSYDQEGNQKKIGKWVELFEGFQYPAQVTFNGEYNMSGFSYLFLNPLGFRQGT